MYNHKEPWEKYPVSMLYNIAEPDKAYNKCHHLLNPFKSMKLPTFIKWTCKKQLRTRSDIAVCGVWFWPELLVYVPQKERYNSNMG